MKTHTTSRMTPTEIKRLLTHAMIVSSDRGFDITSDMALSNSTSNLTSDMVLSNRTSDMTSDMLPIMPPKKKVSWAKNLEEIREYTPSLPRTDSWSILNLM